MYCAIYEMKGNFYLNTKVQKVPVFAGSFQKLELMLPRQF
jgi:hypothetical protein